MLFEATKQMTKQFTNHFKVNIHKGRIEKN